MHGVTKRVNVAVNFLGFGKDGRGVEKAGFEAEAILDRKDFGITWNHISTKEASSSATRSR